MSFKWDGKSRVNNSKYRDNYNSIFKKKKKVKKYPKDSFKTNPGDINKLITSMHKELNDVQ